MKNLNKLMGIIAIIASIGAMVFGASVFAQGPAVGNFFNQTGQQAQDGDTGRGRGGGPRGGGNALQLDGVRAYVDDAVAEVLGLSVADLEAARQSGQRLNELAEAQGVDPADVRAAAEAARQDYLQQAVADGIITQEQADQVGQRQGRQGRQGRGNGRVNRGRPGQGARQGNILRQVEGANEQMQAAVANALGLTVEELQAARADGISLRELAEAQGIDITDLRAAKDAAFQDVVEQAVADGIITQEQADAIGERGNGPRGRGNGPRGNRPGGGPRDGGENNQPPTQEQLDGNTAFTLPNFNIF